MIEKELNEVTAKPSSPIAAAAALKPQTAVPQILYNEPPQVTLLDRLFEICQATHSPFYQKQTMRLKGDSVQVNNDFTFQLI